MFSYLIADGELLTFRAASIKKGGTVKVWRPADTRVEPRMRPVDGSIQVAVPVRVKTTVTVMPPVALV